jgi:DNA gyrase/topoisomerase IV subunit B
MLFVNCSVQNSGFSSQTKEKLITEVKEFGTSHEVSDKLIKQIFDSEIIKSILDWIDKKEQADEKALLRKVAKDLSATKINKLIDAKSRTDRHKCSLFLFEGDSAITSVRTHRDANLMGAFPLRGKFLNVNGMKPADILKNTEAKSIIGAMGLRIGEKAENLRYGAVRIYTDADPDGSGAISSLLINFLKCFFNLSKKLIL